MDLAVGFLMILFALNPVGKASALISHLHLLEPPRRRLIVIRELFLGLAIMIIFLAAVALILKHRGSSPLLVTAGGAVLMLMGVRRIAFGSGILAEVPAEREPLLYPLAFPYIAGPAVLAAELFLIARDPGRWAVWGAASYLAWGASALLLYHSPKVRGVLGRTGVRVCETVAGFGLLVLALELFLYGSFEAAGFLKV